MPTADASGRCLVGVSVGRRLSAPAVAGSVADVVAAGGERAEALGLAETLHVVDLRWLLDSLALWQRLPEEDYGMPWHSVELAAPPPGAPGASAE